MRKIIKTVMEVLRDDFLFLFLFFLFGEGSENFEFVRCEIFVLLVTVSTLIEFTNEK